MSKVKNDTACTTHISSLVLCTNFAREVSAVNRTWNERQNTFRMVKTAGNSIVNRKLVCALLHLASVHDAGRQVGTGMGTDGQSTGGCFHT